MLHITNGDAAAELIRAAGLSGEVVAWRDALHEGPVSGGLSLLELSEVRARFLAEQGLDDLNALRADFARRDAALERFRAHDEVVLWFEHDLYDQLQLVQLLDWLAGVDHGSTILSLICIGEYPGVGPFHGLGQLTPEQLAGLFPSRTPIAAAELELGRAAWTAFRSADPEDLEAVRTGDCDALPFLAAALQRHLEQFPSTRSGLGRTEERILETTARLTAGDDENGGRGCTPVDLFRVDQAIEERPFLGDTVFFAYVLRLASGIRQPLLRLERADAGDSFAQATLRPTPDGLQVHAGEADAVELNGIDRRLGGVHLVGPQARWRWNGATGRLERREA
jgi:hypothetical protein